MASSMELQKGGDPRDLSEANAPGDMAGLGRKTPGGEHFFWVPNR